MGTNYYTVPILPCEKCGRPYQRLHLGKSSAGWAISLQANGFEYYEDWPTMKAWLKTQKIVDEYGDPVTVDEFIKMVEARKDIPDPEPVDYGPSYHFIGGYKFHDSEFS